MSSSIDRASEIVTALISQEVRATTDPSAAVPPCILVPPPGRTFDLGCGFSARWELAAMAPAPSGPDRNSWAVLDELVAAAEGSVVALTSWEMRAVTISAARSMDELMPAPGKTRAR